MGIRTSLPWLSNYCAFFDFVYNGNMAMLTIPKKITGGEELVVLLREDYEKLLQRVIPEYEPTLREKKELQRARADYKKGNFLTLYELKSKLGFKS